MADVFTKEERSAVMARVRGRNTGPEQTVAAALGRLGYRFRLNPPDVHGTPDVVLTECPIVIFVHGCFWHQHRDCEAAKRPGTNRKYWNTKLSSNARRDRRNAALLRATG